MSSMIFICIWLPVWSPIPIILVFSLLLIKCDKTLLIKYKNSLGRRLIHAGPPLRGVREGTQGRNHGGQ